jgi:glycosyltransferase involved in cell wall biosynthesis
MAEPRISVVIRSFNEQNHIERLLIGIFEQSIPDVEVILVDSGSTDRTLSIAGKYPVQIHSIPPHEFSFGGSLNLGCRSARGQFIVLASAHVYPVYQDWLEKLTAPFADPKVAVVYGKQCGNAQTKYSEQRIFLKWYPPKSNSAQNHPFCNNANAAIRRAVWEKMPYDETLTGLEDIDWAKRVFKLCYRIAYAAEAEVVHVHSETPRGIFNRYRREALAMKRIFPEESFSAWDFLRLFTQNTASDIVHAVADHALWGNLTGIFTFRLVQFWGTYRGYTQRGPISQRLRQTLYYPASREMSDSAEPNSEKQPEECRLRIQYTQEKDHGGARAVSGYFHASASRNTPMAGE